MALTKYEPKTRITADKVTLNNVPFSRWLSKRKGVSAKALASALDLISSGIKEAMAEGYAVRVKGLGIFEMKERPACNRYHRKEKIVYLSPATVVATFKKSEFLTKNVKAISQERLDNMHATPTVSKVSQK